MEDVLDLYAEAPDPKRPVVCFDESPTQLIGEVRQPIPAEPGQLERYDCEYRRNGTANLFVFLDAHRPWRKVKVTERRPRRTSPTACASSSMSIIPRPNASASCSTICRPIRPARSTRPSRREARRVLRRLEFHYIPKHASWLNMVEIEIGVLAASASTAASKAARNSSPRSPPGRTSAMPPALASNGCSQPSKPAPNWRAPIQSLTPNQPKPKSHNLCAEVLGERPRRAILAPSLLVAPGRPFVHLFIPSRRLRQGNVDIELTQLRF